LGQSIAAKEGQTAALELLVKAPGCDANLLDENGRTPTLVAVLKGQTAKPNRLIKAGCDVN
jgi:ankyrin repeat protein